MPKNKTAIDQLQAVEPEALDAARANAELRKLQVSLNVTRANLQRAHDRAAALENTIDQFAQISQAEIISGQPIKASDNSQKHSGIAIIHWTDWHVGELVEASKTNGMNSYDPKVCQSRVKGLVNGTVKLIRLHKQNIQIDEIVLVLGGDFITGYLHPELAETNTMGPIEECYFAIARLSESISSLIESIRPKKIRIVCHRGNHGRTTKKMQFKNDFETSYETLIYWVVRDRLKGPGIEWVIPRSSIAYTTLLPGYDIRTAHGHQIKFNGGVGGLLVPGNRWVLKMNQTRRAILTIIGHFHSRNAMNGITVTGSLKGWDEYAQEHGFEFEPPCQSFQLFDCRRRILTSSWPIYCD